MWGWDGGKGGGWKPGNVEKSWEEKNQSAKEAGAQGGVKTEGRWGEGRREATKLGKERSRRRREGGRGTGELSRKLQIA